MSETAILIGDFDSIGPFDSPEHALLHKEKHGLERYQVWPLRAPEEVPTRDQDAEA